MRYMMMVYGPEGTDEAPTPEQAEAYYQEHVVFHNEMADRGIVLAADRLRPSETATVVKVRDGKTLVTDGPYAESKEQMGGYYVFECKDLDEAIQIAAKIPTARRRGMIEVRPIWEPTQEMIDAHEQARNA